MKILSFIFLLFNLSLLHEAGYRGEGMKIAVIDGGFFRANDPNVFPQEQILGVYDLLQGDSTAVNKKGIFDNPKDMHGCMVLSTMLGRDSASGFVGTAPEASYYLIRSEDIDAEYYGEVERLVRAFRLADSLDVDIVTVSLGYSKFDSIDGQVNPRNYSYSDMNGSSVAARAATELVRHGRMVLVSAGNDGNKDWHYISTPADADSILTVGAVDAENNPTPFSSYGPTSDGRLKPEVSALGKDAPLYKPQERDSLGNYIGSYGRANGTSFSAPATAGMVACLWQALPNLTAMELRELIIKSASIYPLHEDQLGYGIPDAWFAYSGEHVSALIPTNGESGTLSAEKHIEEGQLIIIKGGVKYTVLGQPMGKNE